MGQSVWTKKRTFALPAGVNGANGRPSISRVCPDAPAGQQHATPAPGRTRPQRIDCSFYVGRPSGVPLGVNSRS